MYNGGTQERNLTADGYESPPATDYLRFCPTYIELE
jgi:hypothetical protein